MFDAVDDQAGIFIYQDNITVFSHKFHDQFFLYHITQFIQVFKMKFYYSF